MTYFTMKQDQTLPYSIQLRDFDMAGQHQVFYKEEAEKMKDVTFLFIQGKEDAVFPDFIQNPVYMVSECVQGVLDMYEDDLVFKKVVLTNKEMQKQANYYHLLTDHIEALSEQTKKYPDGRPEKIILDAKKIKEHHVFQLKDMIASPLIVSLAVVESLLRRHVQGILFEEVEVL